MEYNILKQHRQSLPIFEGRDKIIREIKSNTFLVIMGETGCGKTTQIPQYLFEELISKDIQNSKMIAITQPRRIAAISVANRVSEEIAPYGNLVSYQVRFDNQCRSHTKIKFLTDGILLRELMTDSELNQYSVIILDEAHEGTVHTDILLGRLKEICMTRNRSSLSEGKLNNTLKLIVMSATLNAEKFSAYLKNCKVVYVPGRQHPVNIFYTTKSITDYATDSIVTALQIHREKPINGDILIFLTGEEEILIVADKLNKLLQLMRKDTPLTQEFTVCTLYGNMPKEKQNKVLEPTTRGTRKIIISTNISETSLTIPGVKYVIDSGKVKRKSYSYIFGTEILSVEDIYHDQAHQRTGRAGREQPGVCYRLYTEEQWEKMCHTSKRDISQSDLSSVILILLAIGVNNPLDFDFFEKPSDIALKTAISELKILQAIEETQESDQPYVLTATGVEMVKYPLEPKLAKLILTSTQKEFKCSQNIITIVAILSVDSFLYTNPTIPEEKLTSNLKKFQRDEGDHLFLLNIYNSWAETNFNHQWKKSHHLHYRNAEMVRKIISQLNKIAFQRFEPSSTSDPKIIQKCILASYFNCIAKYDGQNSYISLSTKQKLYLHPKSSIFHLKPEPEYVVFTNVIWTNKPYMTLVTPVDSSWVTEYLPLISNSRTGHFLSL